MAPSHMSVMLVDTTDLLMTMIKITLLLNAFLKISFQLLHGQLVQMVANFLWLFLTSLLIFSFLSVTYCPNPKNKGTNEIEVVNVQNYNADVEFETVIQWKCKDRRYLIRKAGTTDSPEESIDSTCTWYNTYTVQSSELGKKLFIVYEI